MQSKNLIYVVDDSPSVVDVSTLYLQSSESFSCRGFLGGEDLLEEFVPGNVDCVVADLVMPGISGDELLKRLIERDPFLSFVVVTGYADVKTAVRLMEQGALTLLEKPFTPDQLLAAVQKGVNRTVSLRDSRSSVVGTKTLLAALKEDELQVMNCILAGMPNKAIAHKLTVSSRTVDRRRKSVLEKMKVESVAELAGLVARIDTAPDAIQRFRDQSNLD
jgi:two-component system response regulator FixJ